MRLLILFLFISHLLPAQQEVSYTFKGGWGPALGGIGIKAEIARSNYVAYASLGFKPSFSPNENVTVPSSINPVAGVQYRFFLGDRPFTTRFAVQVGWVDNYYSSTLGQSAYDPHVYGFSFGSGIELLIGSFTIEADIYGATRNLIFNASDHPSFDVVWAPSVAIGFDISGNRVDVSKKWDKWYANSLDWDGFQFGGSGFNSADNRKLKGRICETGIYYYELDTNLIYVIGIDHDRFPAYTKVKNTTSLTFGDTLTELHPLQEDHIQGAIFKLNVEAFNCCMMSTTEFWDSLHAWQTQGEATIVVNKEPVTSDFAKNYKASISVSHAVFMTEEGETIRYDQMILKDIRTSKCKD